MLKSGSSLIELMVYMVLLGFFGHVLFNFTWRMHQGGQQVLNLQIEQIILQSALNTIVNDLRISQLVKRSSGTLCLSCLIGGDTVEWRLENGTLRRIASGNGRARPHNIKVAEGVRELQIEQVACPKFKTSLIQMALVGEAPGLHVRRQVVRRSGMTL